MPRFYFYFKSVLVFLIVNQTVFLMNRILTYTEFFKWATKFLEQQYSHWNMKLFYWFLKSGIQVHLIDSEFPF